MSEITAIPVDNTFSIANIIDQAINKPMKNAKILVAVPYHKAKLYCISQLLSRADELTYQNKEVLMRFDPSEYGSTDAVKKQREFFRNLVINSPDFTHLYFMGVDTIPPKDVLERLLSHEKAIVGGVYWGRHGAENGTSQNAVAWLHGVGLEQQKELFLSTNRLMLIDGMGMDCVLIRRDVLEKISWLSWVQNDDDYPLYDKASQYGRENGLDFGCYIDTNIQCRHYFDKNSYTYLASVCQE